MKTKKSLIIIAVFTCQICLISCTQQTGTENSDRVIEQNTASEITYQSITRRLQDQKTIVLKHEVTYNETSRSTGSIMDKKDNVEAARQIVLECKKLLNLANEALKNKQAISTVSGGENQIINYKKFAEEKLLKYDN